MENLSCMIEIEPSVGFDGDEFCEICGFRAPAGMLNDCAHCGFRLCDYCVSGHMSVMARAAHAH